MERKALLGTWELFANCEEVVTNCDEHPKCSAGRRALCQLGITCRF